MGRRTKNLRPCRHRRHMAIFHHNGEKAMTNENVINKTNTPPPRDSSIELLRIISMVMIIFHHFAVHGGFQWNTSSLSISRFWYNFLTMGGKTGVDIFVLISGYFLVNRKGPIFNFKRILKLWGQVFFYSNIFFLSVGMNDGGILSLIKVFFPITFSSWWFASTYFVLFLIHPFLNRLIHSLDRKLYQSLLVLLVICWCIIPTFTTSKYEGNSLLWFVTLYAISGYARIYGFNPKLKSRHYFILWGIFSILTYLSSVAFTFLGTKWSIFASHATYFYGQNKLPILLVSLTLFMAFSTLKMRYHKWINIIASATFGVYLIHDNDFVRPFLWLNVFKNAQYQDSLMLIPYSIGVVIVVYAVCTLIDLFRQQIIEKPYMKIVNLYSDSWLKPFERICEFFKKIIFGK